MTEYQRHGLTWLHCGPRTGGAWPQGMPPGYFVIDTGVQLHRLCRDRRILHVFYVGAAANMRILFRDHGIRAFRQRGYHVVLRRDCTTAIAGHDTIEGPDDTAQAIREPETVDLVPTTPADALIRAGATAGGW